MSVTYFFSYKSTLIMANQKGYVFYINHYICQFLMYILQILILVKTKNYYYYLVIQLSITVIEYLIISTIANSMYPYLKEKDAKPLNKGIKRDIYNNTLSMVLTKMGSTIVNSTDNILISAFVSISSVARYNNYSTIIGAAAGFLLKGITSTVSSVGNFSVYESAEGKKEIFDLQLIHPLSLFYSISAFIVAI